MTLSDNVYGKFTVEEAILKELLKLPSILRLKGISQYGIPDKYYCFRNFSRYDHSVGVMLLLRKLGATLEEQVAGLIHDVSVLAFSHVADWVFAKGKVGVEDYHDSIHEKFVVSKTKIPKLFKKYGFTLERLLDETNFPLLEKSAPDLCADRVDYALREIEHRLGKGGLARKLAKSLVNFNGEIVFSDQKSALEFANQFLEFQTYHWGGYEAVIRYHLFSEALNIALDEKTISKKDFYGEEPPIINKIEKSKNKRLKELLNLLKKKDLKSLKRDSGKRVFKKFRYVDPKIIANGKLIRLSKLSKSFKKTLEKHRMINKKGLAV